ncbi:putative ribonuclease P complex subunit Pop1 [Sphaerosporella brunnea]|uniref:Putative ribonuclease P complex subunit Pop1 n=1 Tax=Sphaerosporella brunnea TaxID=1250544 RepID=A0A5J5FB27_9PEZI|nr:putative ribonuclease P complex subunit Pop1 [Sphaerosporella brunnea]
MATPTPGQRPNPRKRPKLSPTSGPDVKRARIISSRTIIAQTDLPELKSGALNTSAFIKARRFEIGALEKSMASSKAILKQRAFQSLPRELRRRTASHNTKRVPKRLRARAEKEMVEDNTPTHTFRKRKKTGHDRLRAETAEKLRKMGKKKEVIEKLVGREEGVGGELRKPPRPHSKYRKRQKGKVWLPTHVWHAKRAHIDVRWRFAVPESPNEKCFRSTQRAVEKRGAIAWDTSYWSHILVRGDEELVQKVLEEVCKDAAADKKVRAGRRTKECWVYERGGYPDKPIAPVTVIWSPAEEGPGKGRRVLLRVHPAGFYKVWEELLAAIRAPNIAAGEQKVSIDDLRFELGSIQIAGPSATDALLSVLNPYNPAGETEKAWTGLRGLTNPGALPPDVVLSFEITDPRLHFPPRHDNVPAQQEETLFTIQSTWPVPATPHGLLDPKKRAIAVKLQASLKRIHKRKADAGPGKYPEAIPHDPKIPIIILTSPLAGNKSGVAPPKQSPTAWTIIMPWKWVHPVWYSLMHTPEQVRFGGVQELRQMAFDHGLPWFPADFPGTAAGREWENAAAARRKEIWDKKPPQKRMNYDAVKISSDSRRGEVGDWTRCDWGLLIPQEEQDPQQMETETEPTTSEILASIEEPPPKENNYWHISAPSIAAYLRTFPALPPSLSNLPPSLLARGLFNIKITLLHRGSPTATSRLYRSTPAWKSLATSLLASKGKKPKNKWDKQDLGVVEAGQQGYPQCPGEEELVGFVTTGNYSLSEGRTVALGALSWRRWVEGWEGKERWVVVRAPGEIVGRVGVWEVA